MIAAATGLIWAGHRRNWARLAAVALLTVGLLGGGFWAFTQRPQAVERLIGIKPQVLVTYLTDSNMTVIAGNALLAWGLLGLRACNPAPEPAPLPSEARSLASTPPPAKTPAPIYAASRQAQRSAAKSSETLDDFEEQVY